MLEMMMTGRRHFTRPTLPSYTGPGPQELIGWSIEAGFFGEVPVSELINGNDLATMIGLTAGTAQNPTAPWLKFYLDGRILFVAKQPYRHTISWDQLQAVDAVEGSRRLEINGNPYLIGLLEGIGEDHSVITTGYDPQCSHGSEWNRLMYNVAVSDSYERGSQTGDNWANYLQTAVADGLWLSAGNGRYNWCKEVWPANAMRRVLRGNYSVSGLNYNASSVANSNYGWRPRLELVTA